MRCALAANPSESVAVWADTTRPYPMGQECGPGGQPSCRITSHEAKAYVAFHHDLGDRIQYYKFCVDLAKALLVGFGAALLGILIRAVFTNVEPLHLFRYLDERTFRYNHRAGIGAGDRFDIAVRQIVGKRLTYDTLIGRGLFESRPVV